MAFADPAALIAETPAPSAWARTAYLVVEKILSLLRGARTLPATAN